MSRTPDCSVQLDLIRKAAARILDHETFRREDTVQILSAAEQIADLIDPPSARLARLKRDILQHELQNVAARILAEHLENFGNSSGVVSEAFRMNLQAWFESWNQCPKCGVEHDPAQRSITSNGHSFERGLPIRTYCATCSHESEP